MQSYLQSIIVNLLEEVASKGTIASLVSSVNEYINNKSNMKDTVKSEHDCRQLVKDLRKQLVEVKREKEEQITKLDEDVAHCKDQLQELKARTGLLNKYIKKQSDVKVQCSQRQQQNKESDLYNERERLKQELAEEKRAHAEIENYLKKHIEDLDGKVEYWMSKYEEDLEMKTTKVQETNSESVHHFYSQAGGTSYNMEQAMRAFTLRDMEIKD
uniref:Uncharacterized protein n=1 Tax=Amphimedon queenslandica TaxID=400682 RepID=A0A1X7T4W8_AMPQE